MAKKISYWMYFSEIYISPGLLTLEWATSIYSNFSQNHLSFFFSLFSMILFLMHRRWGKQPIFYVQCMEAARIYWTIYISIVSSSLNTFLLCVANKLHWSGVYWNIVRICWNVQLSVIDACHLKNYPKLNCWRLVWPVDCSSYAFYYVSRWDAITAHRILRQLL